MHPRKVGAARGIFPVDFKLYPVFISLRICKRTHTAVGSALRISRSPREPIADVLKEVIDPFESFLPCSDGKRPVEGVR